MGSLYLVTFILSVANVRLKFLETLPTPRNVSDLTNFFEHKNFAQYFVTSKITKVIDVQKALLLIYFDISITPLSP